MVHFLITLFVVGILYPHNLHREGAALAALFYLGREHAQAEYRSIVGYYNGKRVNAPWWCGFEPRSWNRKSILDWLLPVVVAIITWGL